MITEIMHPLTLMQDLKDIQLELELDILCILLDDDESPDTAFYLVGAINKEREELEEDFKKWLMPYNN